MSILAADVVSFLAEGTRTGTLAYLATDGRPLAAPVWFVVDRGGLVFTTPGDSAKGRALRRDPRVVLVVDEPRPPYSFVQVQGEVTITEDPVDLLDMAIRIGGRYMGADRAEEFGRRNGVPGELLVRIDPSRVRKSFDVTG